MNTNLRNWLFCRRQSPVIQDYQLNPSPVLLPLPLGIFYDYGPRLLHITPELVGIVSAVSIGIPPPPRCSERTVQTQTAFVLCDECFILEVDIRRNRQTSWEYERIDLFRNGERLLFQEKGLRQGRQEYSLGHPIHLGKERAYMLVRGLDLRHGTGATWQGVDPQSLYLLRLDHAVQPQLSGLAHKKPKHQKPLYRRPELLPLRQPGWSAQIPHTPIGALEVTVSEVPGFYYCGEQSGHAVYAENQFMHCLRRTELCIGGRLFVFE